jgi:hypothetical protein
MYFLMLTKVYCNVKLLKILFCRVLELSFPLQIFDSGSAAHFIQMPNLEKLVINFITTYTHFDVNSKQLANLLDVAGKTPKLKKFSYILSNDGNLDFDCCHESFVEQFARTYPKRTLRFKKLLYAFLLLRFSLCIWKHWL